jgi:hypothetical protein
MNNKPVEKDAVCILPIIKLGRAIPIIRGNVP